MTRKRRPDGRLPDQLRPVEIQVGVQRNPEGSVLYQCGGTRVLIAASIEENVKDFLRGTGRGWVTAEYEMHPRANAQRRSRERSRLNLDGRTQEIQRLIGRSLRSALDTSKLGERTVTIDCDVLDADGGTRTACITGGFIALAIALDTLRAKGNVRPGVIRKPIAAISVGLLDDVPLLDLAYEEDKRVQVDLNVVASTSGNLVEVQGTAEGAPIGRGDFDTMLDLALSSVNDLWASQKQAILSANANLEYLIAERVG